MYFTKILFHSNDAHFPMSSHSGFQITSIYFSTISKPFKVDIFDMCYDCYNFLLYLAKLVSFFTDRYKVKYGKNGTDFA